MNNEPELPADVLEALQANRKIQAIKLLRVQRGIDLKDAKEIVDQYLENNPPVASRRRAGSETGTSRFLLIIIAIALVYAASRYVA